MALAGPMSARVEQAEQLEAREDDDNESLPWSREELATVSLRGSGRVLCVRPSASAVPGVERCLQQAGYRVGRLPITRECSHLPLAAASFVPDVVYVTLASPTDACIDALETLAADPRTCQMPLVALVPHTVQAGVIEEAYTRSGCDFFRLGATHVELLARTHLLVRLSARAYGVGVPLHPQLDPEVANSSGGQRLDLCDSVTGVYSSTYFRHRLQQEIARAHRYQRPLTLVVVRSRLSTHDEVAARLADALGRACRNVDLVARLEPDLFAVLLPETTVTKSHAVVARIRQEAESLAVACRIGVAGLGVGHDDGAQSASSLLQLASARADG
jgi:PleD family two-component response regulator